MRIVRVDEPVPPGERVTLAEPKDVVMLVVAGETVEESAMTPVRPRLPSVIVEDTWEPAGKLRDDKLEVMLKSALTVAVNRTECTIELLVPFSMTV